MGSQEQMTLVQNGVEYEAVNEKEHSSSWTVVFWSMKLYSF
jgi:hypothetical protein